MTAEGSDEKLKNLASILRAKSFTKRLRKASLNSQEKAQDCENSFKPEEEGELQKLLSTDSSSKLGSNNECLLSSGGIYEMQEQAAGSRLSVADTNKHTYISIRPDQRMMLGGPNGNFEYGSLTLNVGKRRRKRRPKCNDFVELKNLICGSWLNLLLFCSVPGWLAHAWGWKSEYIFLFNFLVIIPLAALLGDMTEALGGHLGNNLGGFLSATFGNAVEIILAIQTILWGELRVLKAFLLGSIFSNTLLILGLAYIFSGKKAEFQTREASAPAFMILVSAFILVVTSVHAINSEAEHGEVKLVSRVGALILLFIYWAYLIFSLRAHSQLLHSDAEVEEQHVEELSIGGSLGGLAITTVLVGIFSEFLVASIDDFAFEWGISKTFLGVIILPIIGNFIEHVTAVGMAREGKMDVAVSISLGSTAQIGLLVIPAAVISGWIIHVPVIIGFTSLEIILLVLSIVLVLFVVVQGKASFITGLVLLCLYGFLALVIWFEKVPVMSH